MPHYRQDIPARVRTLVLARAASGVSAAYPAKPVPGCEMCAQSRVLTLHHRVQRSVGGRHEVANLLALCRPCHDQVHLRVERSHQYGRLVHSWDNPADTPVLLSMGWVLLDEEGHRSPHPGPTIIDDTSGGDRRRGEASP